MKKIIFFGFAILLLMPCLASALTQIYADAGRHGNQTFRTHQQTYFSSETKSQLNTGEKLNFYVQYSCPYYSSIDSFNSIYSNHHIKNMTLTFTTYPAVSLANGSSLNESPVIEVVGLVPLGQFNNYKKFFSIGNREYVTTDLDTTYITAQNYFADAICRFDVVYGTEGCDRCLELEYYDFVQDTNYAQQISNYNTNIYTRIKQLFEINYEFLVIIYYLILISILIVTIGAFLYAIMLGYHYIQHLVERK